MKKLIEKARNYLDKVKGLNRYYLITRKVGHTTLLADGFKKSEGFALMGHSVHQAEFVLRNHWKGNNREHVRAVSLHNLNYNDLALPLVIDNSAMHHMMEDNQEIIQGLLDIITIYENKFGKLNDIEYR